MADAPSGVPDDLDVRAAEIEIEVRWFGQSAHFSDDDDAKIYTALGVDKEGVKGKISKNLFPRSFTEVKEINAAKKEVFRWRDQWTMPMASALTAGGPATEKAPGRRLVLVKNLRAFFEGLDAREETLVGKARALEAALPEIKAFCQRTLRDRYDATDWPKDIAGKVKVLRSAPRSVGIAAGLEQLAPEEFEKARTKLRQMLEASVALHIEEFAQTAVERLELLSRQLKRVVVVTPSSPEWVHYRGCEELRVRAEIVDSVPTGQVLVTLYDAGAKKEQTLPLMTRDAYERDFRPTPQAELRKLHESSFTEIDYLLKQFEQTAEMLGERGKPTKQLLDQVRSAFRETTGRAEAGKAASVVRSSGTSTRERLAKALDDVVDGLAVQAQGEQTIARSRRVRATA
jgi:hypothetical protein